MLTALLAVVVAWLPSGPVEAATPLPHRVDTIPLGDQTAIGINERTSTIYFGIGSTPSILAVDSGTDQVVARLSGACCGYYYLVPDERTSALFASGIDDSLYTIRQGARVGAAIPAAGEPDGLAVDERTGTIYTTDVNTFNVNVVDEATGRRTATIQTDFGRGLALDPARSRLYVAEQNDVAVINTRTNRVVHRIHAPGLTPTWLAVNVRTGTLYAPGSEGLLFAISSDGRLIGSLALNRDLGEIAVDQTSNRLYVLDRGPLDFSIAGRDVLVIDGNHLRRLGSVQVGYSPLAVAVDQVTHRIYAATQNHVAVLR